MQTQAISNTKSNVKFQSRNDFKNAENFVNMSDDQIQELAYAATDKTQDDKSRRALMGTFIAIPIVDSIAKGVLATEKVGEAHFFDVFTGKLLAKKEIFEPARMSKRLVKTGGTAAGWALAIGAVGLYSFIKKQFVKNSPDAQQFGQEHPILSFAGDIAVILGACFLGIKGIDKLSKTLEKKYPKSVEELKGKFERWSKDRDKSDFNTKTLPNMTKWFAELEEKHPLVSKSGKFLLDKSAFILLGVAFVQMLSYGKNKAEAVNQNYQELRSAQLEAAKHVVNSLSVQKDILAQNQQQSASDLEKAINGEKPVSESEIKEFKKSAKIYEAEKLKVKAWQNELEKQAEKPEVISDIEIVRIIHIPDKKADK